MQIDGQLAEGTGRQVVDRMERVFNEGNLEFKGRIDQGTGGDQQDPKRVQKNGPKSKMQRVVIVFCYVLEKFVIIIVDSLCAAVTYLNQSPIP